MNLKSLIFSKPLRRFLDVILSPLTFLGAVWFRYIRSRTFGSMGISKKIFNSVGVFPISDHYYEPLFNTEKHLKKPLSDDRILPGIFLNDNVQLEFLEKFKYQDELLALPVKKTSQLQYYYENGSFGAGDAELLYNMVREIKPARIVEVGCGFSSLMIESARGKNINEGKNFDHICIEPYEMDWLEHLNIKVMRKKVEELPLAYFSILKENDILFIDSSHMIRPQGDVLYEILQLLPSLNKGVYIHFHDVFTPKDYTDSYVKENNRFWNEQYLLEAFLCFNNQFEFILASNYLVNHYPEQLFKACPVMKNLKVSEPGSIWIRKTQ